MICMHACAQSCSNQRKNETIRIQKAFKYDICIRKTAFKLIIDVKVRLCWWYSCLRATIYDYGQDKTGRTYHSDTQSSQKMCLQRSEIGACIFSWQIAHMSPAASTWVRQQIQVKLWTSTHRYDFQYIQKLIIPADSTDHIILNVKRLQPFEDEGHNCKWHSR